MNIRRLKGTRMLNVFVISSDERIAALIEHFQPYFKTKIRSAADFDHGLKEVFENRPSIVFIQSTIGTVSGETVARHIKSLLGSESPCIVFVDNGDTTEKKRVSWCDDWMSLADSAEQLRENFTAIIANRFPGEWQEIVAEITGAATAQSSATVSGKTSGEVCQHIVGQVSETCDNLQDELSAGSLAIPAEGDPLPVQVVPAVTKDSKAVTSEPVYPEAVGTKVAVSRAPQKSRSVLLIGLVVLVILAVSYGVWVQVLQKEPVNADRAAPGVTAVPPVVSGLKKLPGFIDPKWHDSVYAATNPGWERYRSHEFEFRVYTAGGIIQALQIISLRPEGIPAAYLRDVLQQTGHQGPLPSGSEHTKDGFVVKTYHLSGKAELVVYVEQGGSAVRAAVLAF